MRATVLVENESARNDLRFEHGLALWIETGNSRVLFDTGASDALIDNSARLGIDLSAADAIVLSHGHHDHSGGLAAVTGVAPGAAVFVGPDATVPKYSRKDGTLREIGIDHQTVNAIAHRLRVVHDGQELVPGVTVLADFGSVFPLPEDNDRLLVRGEDGMVPDPFLDEIALLLETAAGPVLISGCSHRGIGNIVAKAVERAGRLAAVIGGFHLHKESDATITRIAAGLHDIPQIHAAHCTGEGAMEVLGSTLGAAVRPFAGGSVIQVD